MDCSLHACPNECSNHGVCENWTCVCDPEYTGYDCSLLACAPNCSLHGYCYNGTCYCAPGFTGSDCMIATCPNHCSGHGRCDGGKWRCDWCQCKADETTGKGPGPAGASTLCANCAGSLATGEFCDDNLDPYRGQSGAFKCLLEGGGDVAFMKHSTPYFEMMTRWYIR